MSAQRRNPASVFGSFIGLIAFSVIAGILVTAALTPALAVTGSAAKGTIGIFEDLPDYITISSQAQRNEIYAKRGGKDVQIATVFNQNRQDVGWDDVSGFIKDAAVAGEDRRFYSHGGIDLQSFARAGMGYLTHTGSTGGSTIAMQLVKNIRISNALQLPTAEARDAAYKVAIQTTPNRKLEEMKLAIGLEKKYSKKTILLAYLNINLFGGITYGIQAAAERYFSVSAKDVTPAQAASLVAIVQSPSAQRLDIVANHPTNKARRDTILKNMLQMEKISKAQYETAVASPIASYVKLSAPNNGCLNATAAKFFCDYVLGNIKNVPSLGETPASRLANWSHGGYKIYTSLDLDQQQVAQDQIDRWTPATETRFALGSSAVAIQPGTGKILVMAQNKSYNNTPEASSTETSINFGTDKAYGGSSGFQTGSTYKIFTLTAWLQKGHGLQEMVNGSQRTFPQSTFKCAGVPLAGQDYSPKNDSAGEGGSMTVSAATVRSVNVAYVSMAQKLDLCDIRDDAKAMGVHRADGSPLKTDPSSVLGINEISPLTMANAIATIGAGGTFCAPTAIDRVVDVTGKVLPGQTTACTTNVIDPGVAAADAYALSPVFKSGTATSANPGDGVPIMGKTGTTDGSYQNWLIGSTTKVALAVWVGNIKGTQARTENNPAGNQSLRQIKVAGTSGYNLKFNIFKASIKALNANPEYRGGDFPAPDPTLINGRGVSIPPTAGQSASQAQTLLESLDFAFADGGPVPSSQPAGTVAYTDPAAGSIAPTGSSVTVYTSDGSLATVVPVLAKSPLLDAKVALLTAGFSVANISLVWVAGLPTNICLVQSSTPAAGASASKSDPVSLTVYGNPDGSDPGAAVCKR